MREFRNLDANQLILLVLAAIYLITQALGQFYSELGCSTVVTEKVMLRQVNGELTLVNEQHDESVDADRDRASHLTPFFFEPVPINSADYSLLSTLPGIGPAMAERIVQHRRQHGPVTTIKQLEKIPGIGEKRSAQLANHITFK